MRAGMVWVATHRKGHFVFGMKKQYRKARFRKAMSRRIRSWEKGLQIFWQENHLPWEKEVAV